MSWQMGRALHTGSPGKMVVLTMAGTPALTTPFPPTPSYSRGLTFTLQWEQHPGEHTAELPGVSASGKEGKWRGALKGVAGMAPGTAGLGAAVTRSGPLFIWVSPLKDGPNSSLPLLKEEWQEGKNKLELFCSSQFCPDHVYVTCADTRVNTQTHVSLLGYMEFLFPWRMFRDCCAPRLLEPLCSVHWPVICPNGCTMTVTLDCEPRPFPSLLCFFSFPLAITGVSMAWEKSHCWYKQ